MVAHPKCGATIAATIPTACPTIAAISSASRLRSTEPTTGLSLRYSQWMPQLCSRVLSYNRGQSLVGGQEGVQEERRG